MSPKDIIKFSNGLIFVLARQGLSPAEAAVTLHYALHTLAKRQGACAVQISRAMNEPDHHGSSLVEDLDSLTMNDRERFDRDLMRAANDFLEEQNPDRDSN